MIKAIKIEFLEPTYGKGRRILLKVNNSSKTYLTIKEAKNLNKRISKVIDRVVAKHEKEYVLEASSLSHKIDIPCRSLKENNNA